MKLSELLNKNALNENSNITEDVLRQAMAESGKTRANDLKAYLKHKFPDMPFTAKELTAIVKEFRTTLDY